LEPTARSINTVSIIRVPQGKEPNVFKRMFPAWDERYWKVGHTKMELFKIDHSFSEGFSSPD